MKVRYLPVPPVGKAEPRIGIAVPISEKSPRDKELKNERLTGGKPMEPGILLSLLSYLFNR